MPNSAKIKINRKSSNNKDMIDLMELSNEITRFRREDQQLKIILLRIIHLDLEIFTKKYIIAQLCNCRKSIFNHLYLHCNLENTQKSKCPQHRQTERTSFWFEMRPYHLKNAARYNNAIKAIEGGLKVYSWSQGPHPQKHFKDEQA